MGRKGEARKRIRGDGKLPCQQGAQTRDIGTYSYWDLASG